MKFKDLFIKNFLSIGTAEINLADRGLVLIQGENADNTSSKSNGSGKSSIADAIVWVLYGVTTRNVGSDEVVNKKIGKYAVVSLSIIDDANEYKIFRYRKPTSLVVHHRTKGGSWSDITKGTATLTQELIDSIVGCPLEVFKACIYSSQESMVDIPSLSDKSLKVLIEEAAGIRLLEQAYTVAKAKYTTSSAEFAVENSILEALKRSENDSSDRLAEQNDRLTQLESERKAIIDAKKSYISSVNAEMDKLKAALLETGSYEELREKNKTLIEACDTLSQVRNKKFDIMNHRSNLESKAMDLRFAIRHSERDISDYKTEIKAKSSEVSETCVNCGKSFPIDSDRMTRINDEISYLNRKIADCRNSIDIRTKKLAEFEEAIKDVHKEAESARRTESDLVKEINKPEYLGICDNMDKAARIETEILDNRHRLERANEAINNADRDYSGFASVVTTMAEDHAKLKKNSDLQSDKLKSIRDRIEVLRGVTAVFSPSGVRSKIIEEVTPFLNERTEKYLSAMSDGNITAKWNTVKRNSKGEFVDKFNIEVSDKTGGDSFKSLSGGEKRKVRIATSLALQDLTAARAFKPIDLFIGDEIDDALDEPGLERLMGILEDKAKERGSVFIISHNPLKDWISKSIKVTKKGGLSTITEE